METALEAAAKSFISQEVEVHGNQVSYFCYNGVLSLVIARLPYLRY